MGVLCERRFWRSLMSYGERSPAAASEVLLAIWRCAFRAFKRSSIAQTTLPTAGKLDLCAPVASLAVFSSFTA